MTEVGSVEHAAAARPIGRKGAQLEASALRGEMVLASNRWLRRDKLVWGLKCSWRSSRDEIASVSSISKQLRSKLSVVHRMRTSQRLSIDFYAQPTVDVARNLLGKAIVRQLETGETLAGIVVETEAYLPADDPASHSFRGPGRKNASMFEAAGTLYVYPIHAKFCMNVVTEAKGQGAAVLIRAAQPIEGISSMREHRGITSLAEPLTRLTTGPARMCQALAVNRSLDGVDLLTSSSIWLETEPQAVTEQPWTARTSARIGISQAVEMPLRWFIDGNRFVSGCARDHSRRRDWCFE